MDEEAVLITFIAIIAGLGLRDLLSNLHRLLKFRHRIKWHWIPMVHAFAVFMTMIIFWYNIFTELNSPLTATSLGFFVWLIPVIILLLLMLAVLPDQEPSADFDLLAWYFNQRKYYFSLLCLYILSLTMNRYLLFESKTFWYAPLFMFFFAFLSLFTAKYSYHAFFAVLLILFFLFNFYGQIVGIV